jgi:hypothetical protein
VTSIVLPLESVSWSALSAKLYCTKARVISDGSYLTHLIVSSPLVSLTTSFPAEKMYADSVRRGLKRIFDCISR